MIMFPSIIVIGRPV